MQECSSLTPPLCFFRSSTTVQEYGEYQQEMLHEERRSTRNKAAAPPRKMLKFGTNCDLSDQEK